MAVSARRRSTVGWTSIASLQVSDRAGPANVLVDQQRRFGTGAGARSRRLYSSRAPDRVAPGLPSPGRARINAFNHTG